MVEAGVVYIGKKPTMNYVLAVVTHFNDGSREVIVKARGRSISRAVDVAEIVRERFIPDAEVRDVRISTEKVASGAASVYVRDHLTNLRLAMFLEVATTLGAIAGALVGLGAPDFYLYLVFGVVVLYAATTMVRVRETAKERAYRGGGKESPLTKRLKLSSVYFDQEDQGVYRYRVERPVTGFGVSAAAGLFSGLLGVGGGFLKVPAMNVLMRVPMKAAVATSNFMIGVTAAASAVIYDSRGLVVHGLAAIVIL